MHSIQGNAFGRVDHIAGLINNCTVGSKCPAIKGISLTGESRRLTSVADLVGEDFHRALPVRIDQRTFLNNILANQVNSHILPDGIHGKIPGMLFSVPVDNPAQLISVCVRDLTRMCCLLALFHRLRLCLSFVIQVNRDGTHVCIRGNIGLLIFGNWRRIHVKSFYVTVGCALWYCMHGSGIHATIAGVILAFCVPASLRNGTKFYIERIRKCLSNFPVIEVTHADRSKPALLTESQVHQLKSIESASDRLISPLQDLEDSLKNPINLLIIPLFAFANAGVNLSGMDLSNLFSGVGLSVLLGLLVGKFVGVFSFSWISIKMGWVQLPANSTWKSFASVCMLCGIGFTVSMFMADLSYRPVNELGMLADSKLGILCGSIASALIGAFLLNKHLPKDASETVTK